MATFNLPDLGEGLAEAEIVRWHVNVGDPIKVDEPMVAVETAKAVVEVPSPYTGKVTALHGKPGDVVATGAPLVEFEVTGKTEAPAEAKTAAEPRKAADPRKADDSGTVVGSMPTSDEELVENAVAGSDIAISRDRVRAAPAVRALAKKLGVDLASVPGTGRGGLITVDDVMKSGNASHAPSASAPAAAPANVTALKPNRAPSSASDRRSRKASWPAPSHASEHEPRAGQRHELHAVRRRGSARLAQRRRLHRSACSARSAPPLPPNLR